MKLHSLMFAVLIAAPSQHGNKHDTQKVPHINSVEVEGRQIVVKGAYLRKLTLYVGLLGSSVEESDMGEADLVSPRGAKERWTVDIPPDGEDSYLANAASVYFDSTDVSGKHHYDIRYLDCGKHPCNGMDEVHRRLYGHE